MKRRRDEWDEGFVVTNPEAGFTIKGLQEIRKLIKAIGRKTCFDCIFCETREETFEKPSLSALFGAPEIDMRIQLVCRKFLLNINGKLKSALNCSSFLTEKEYHEKALKGEIVGFVGLQKDEMEFTQKPEMATCQYCTAQYDITLYLRCPNCGASNPKLARMQR